MMPKWYEFKWLKTEPESEWYLRYSPSHDAIARVQYPRDRHLLEGWELTVGMQRVRWTFETAEAARAAAEAHLGIATDGPCKLVLLP